MKVTFLGTGTSTGVPTLGCSCSVCRSTNPHNNRMRSSVLVEDKGTCIVIDTGPEFRIQALRAGIMRLDGVLITHAHADHLHGLDDVRPLTHHVPLNIYLDQPTEEAVHRLFPYFFTKPTTGTSVPDLILHKVTPGVPFPLGNLLITPLKVFHGTMPILGYRLGSLAYITDCSQIPQETLDQLKGLDVLILDSLRPRPHPTHFSESQAIAAAQAIGAKRTYFTHMNHDLDHNEFAARLPSSLSPAYDGLVVDL